MSKSEKSRFSFAVFPLLKHRWKHSRITKKRGIFVLVKGENTKEKNYVTELSSISSVDSINYEDGYYQSGKVKISFECYSFLQCTRGKTINEFDEHVLRGLMEGGNKLKIFCNTIGDEKDSVGVLGNPFPFTKVSLASLTANIQGEIFDAWIKHRQVILTGGTGVGKTSQVPKLLLWFNYLFGGFPNLERITEFNEKEIVLSLPRIALVRLHGETLLRSLGFDRLTESPISVRFGSMPPELINSRPRSYGIVFSTHKLTLSKLFDYSTVIVDEVHEHDSIGDIVIAVSRKHIGRLDSLFLMTATLEDDRERLKEFLPDPVFIHIPGGTLFPISEIYVPNRINPKDKTAYIREEKKNIVDAIRQYTPPNGSSGLVFVASVAQCKSYGDYIGSKLPFSVYIIHGKIEDVEKVLSDIYNNRGVSIIVATPYLESSITIANATHVYDVGRVYVASPFGGSQRIISRSMRDQRKGRVGRVKPGTYVYFYDPSRMKTIKRIDSEFLYEYVLYARHFKLNLPNDLLVIPSDLTILNKTEEYLDTFNIKDETWFYLLSTRYMKSIEYAKIYVLGGDAADKLDRFERTGMINEETLSSIASLNLRAKIIKVKKKGQTYLHTCKIMFGPFYGTTMLINSPRIMRGYVKMINYSDYVYDGD